jgi:hypothetical protein
MLGIADGIDLKAELLAIGIKPLDGASSGSRIGSDGDGDEVAVVVGKWRGISERQQGRQSGEQGGSRDHVGWSLSWSGEGEVNICSVYSAMVIPIVENGLPYIDIRDHYETSRCRGTQCYTVSSSRSSAALSGSISGRCRYTHCFPNVRPMSAVHKHFRLIHIAGVNADVERSGRDTRRFDDPLMTSVFDNQQSSVMLNHFLCGYASYNQCGAKC